MATEEKKKDPRTVQLLGVRGSFTDALVEKKKTANTDDAKEKYGCNLILETTGPMAQYFEANKAKIRAALEAAGEQAWKNPDAYKGLMEDDPKRLCYRKGERFKNQETSEVYKGYAGNWAISGGTPGGGQRRPKLYDRRKREVPEKDIAEVFFGGCYFDVVVSFYGTDKGGRGIFCTIEAIRSREEGERMAGGWTGGADAFDDLEDGADAFEGTSSSAADDNDGLG